MKPNDEIEIRGTIESVVFHTEETGYTVCNVRSAEEIGDFTLVGNCSAIWEGEEVVARGAGMTHLKKLTTPCKKWYIWGDFVTSLKNVFICDATLPAVLRTLKERGMFVFFHGRSGSQPHCTCKKTQCGCKKIWYKDGKKNYNFGIGFVKNITVRGFYV